MASKEYEVKLFISVKEFEEWLESQHDKQPGIWLKFAKKNSGKQSVTYAEAVQIALCYGWIDSQAKSLDESYYLQKFTPRGPRSIWSKINTEHVACLIKERKMQPAGLLEVEKAKSDGRWEREIGRAHV